VSDAPAPQSSQITLRALEGRPLENQQVRNMVIATAAAIAERQGVNLLAIKPEADRVTVTLDVGQLEILGFAAELRRLTTRWYTQKYGETTLWGDAPADEGEQWKRA
jgi:hypothetical protein